MAKKIVKAEPKKQELKEKKADIKQDKALINKMLMKKVIKNK